MYPEDAAEALLKKHGVNRLPIPVEEIARAEGALVVRQRFDGDTSGFMYSEGNRIIIGINSATSRRRQRFTLAHECAHMTLHRQHDRLRVDSVIQFRDDLSTLGIDPKEREANSFAAALLMPAGFVNQELRANKGLGREELIGRLAQVFDVSTEAMGYRLINLGVLRA